MKKYLLTPVFICAVLFANAQQDPLYSQYINNPLAINPAVAGMSDNLTANLSYRKQWNGFDGSPVTVNANVHLSILNNTAGAGLMVLSDKIGNTAVTEAFAIGSYRIKLDDSKVLSFGLQAGVMNFKLSDDKVNPYDLNDPYYQGNISQLKPNIGVGALLKTSRLDFGISVPRLLASSTNIQGAKFALYNQHAYVMAAYKIPVSARFDVKPTVLLKAVKGAPLSADLNGMFILDGLYQIGALSRNFQTYGMIARAQVKQFALGLVYEVPTSRSVGTKFNTYEITLGFRMNALQYHKDEAPARNASNIRLRERKR